MEWRNEEFDLETSELPAVSRQQRRIVAERAGVRV